jgi:hypothetical protein
MGMNNAKGNPYPALAMEKLVYITKQMVRVNKLSSQESSTI